MNCAAASEERSDKISLLVDLEVLGRDRFRGHAVGANYRGTIFGGQLIAQALIAACNTVADLLPISLHSYFLAAPKIAAPLEFAVTRLREGGSFSHRRVTVSQEGNAVFEMIGAFQREEQGFDHQYAMPEVPEPEDLPTLAEFARSNADRLPPAAAQNFAKQQPCELRPVNAASFMFDRSDEARRDLWFRLQDAAALERQDHQRAMIAYCSDLWLAGVCAVPHDVPTNSDALLIASLDHSIWFHRHARCDDWMLHCTQGPSAHGGRGMTRGLIFDRQGRLVASTAQDVLLRRPKTKGS